MLKARFAVCAAAAAFVMITGPAWADSLCTEPLPNARWQGYNEEQTVIGDPNQAGSSGNVFVLVATQCNAVNPGGQVDDGHSYQLGEPTEIKICQNVSPGVGTLTQEGADLGYTQADCPGG